MREGAIVQISTTANTTGVGEIAPLSEFSGVTLTDALRPLPMLGTQLIGITLHEALNALLVGTDSSRPRASTNSVSNTSASGRNASIPATDMNASLRCGLEMALLDALGKQEECTVSTLLAEAGTVPRTSIAVNAVVGAQSIDEAAQVAQRACEQGFGCIKLKVGNMGSVQAEIERVATVREAIGPAIHLRLDANEAWTYEQARTVLGECAPYNVEYVEQPLSRNDLEGAYRLRQTQPIPIAADEAIHDLASAQRIIAHSAADILIIKPQLAGGLRMGQRIIAEAAHYNIQAVITTTIESGVSQAASLQLAAACPTVTRACGLATAHLLVDDLLLDKLAIHNGTLTVPQKHGLGVLLDNSALQHYSYNG